MLTTLRSENYRLTADDIFQDLSKETQQTIISSGVTHRYKKGEIIFREGGIPTGIFYINQGLAKKYTLTHKGGEQIFYICGRGEILGYHALLGETLYPDSAATIEESEITFIPKEPFLNALSHSIHFSNKLLKVFGKEFTLFVNSMSNLATKTVKERIAVNLLVLEEKYRVEGKPEKPDILISRTDLANLVGTAKESLVRMLHEFEKAGMIERTSHSIKVLNRKKLMKVANLTASGTDRLVDSRT